MAFWDVAPGGVRAVLGRFEVAQGDLRRDRERYLDGIAEAERACGGLAAGGGAAAGGRLGPALAALTERADSHTRRMLDRSHASRGGAELATVAYVEGDGQMELRARQAEMTHVEPMPFRLPPGGGGTDADRAV